MLLSTDSGNQRGHARAPGYLEANRPPAADVCGVGVRLSGREAARPGRSAIATSLSANTPGSRTTRRNRFIRSGGSSPNALGLFDMLGNALEWCHESVPHVDRNPTRDVEDPSPVDAGVDRFLRGGAYIHRAEGIRSDTGHAIAPKTLWDDIGFRVVRTIRADR